MNRCIANPRSPKLQDSKTVSLNAESARIPQSRAVSTQPGPVPDLNQISNCESEAEIHAGKLAQ